MSQLNANASEWRPSGTATAASYLTELALPPPMVDAVDAAAENRGSAFPAAVPGFSAAAHEFTPGRASQGTPPLATTAAVSAATPYYPTFSTGAAATGITSSLLGDVDWKAEFDKVMELTAQMIEQQLHPPTPEGQPAAATTTSTAAGTEAASTVPVTSTATDEEGVSAGATPPPGATTPVKTYAAAVIGGQAGKKPETKDADKGRKSSSSATGTSHPSAKAPSEVSRKSEKRFDFSDGRSLPPLTVNGNRRWKKPTKAEQKREQAQRNAFEAFAGALLHSVSPFMAPLRAKCKKALPHLKIDQRFGKSGQPQSAIAQFVAAPLVTNYRPRHFHDVSPGDLEEFMWELAHALDVMPSAYSLIIGYGPVWKRYAVPYLYIACKDYQKEVLSLCPDEIPNSRTEAIYEDDVIKDVTDVILAVNELGFLEEMSMLAAMKARTKFQAMFDAFDQLFAPLENYQIEITNLRERPSRFLIKVSQLQVDQKPQPITLYNDPKLWYELPVVARIVVKTGKTADPSGPTAGSGGAAAHAGHSSEAGKFISRDGDSEETGEEDEDSDAASDAGVAKAVPGGKASRKEGAGSGGPGVSPWLVATPVVLSVLCSLATIGLIASKKRKQ